MSISGAEIAKWKDGIAGNTKNSSLWSLWLLRKKPYYLKLMPAKIENKTYCSQENTTSLIEYNQIRKETGEFIEKYREAFDNLAKK